MAKSLIRKMTLGEIRRKAHGGALSDAEILHVFKAEASAKNVAEVSFVDAHVDFTGFEVKPGEAAELLEACRKKARSQAKAAKTGLEAAKAKKQIAVLAEGDSWFNLPYLLWPKTLMDFIDETHAVNNLAFWGDTLDEMVENGAYKPPLGSGLYRHFFLSGGGNDVLQSIKIHVKPHVGDDDDPLLAPGYVKPSFNTALKRVLGLYAKVADAVPANSVLYVHGYAYARPIKNGKHLGKPFAELGFDLTMHGKLAAAVVRHMIDMFNERLIVFAASRARVVYVNLRDEMKATDWNWDEIHPKAQAAERLAAIMREKMLANTPIA